MRAIRRRGPVPFLSLGALLLVAACGSPQVAQIRVSAIANQDEEAIPCAILIDRLPLLDKSGAPVQTPATIPVTFEKDPTGAYPFLPVTIGVLALIDDHGKLRLPDDVASEFPAYRYAERSVRPTDSKNQLFILLRNTDQKIYRLPRTARPSTQ